MEKTQIITKEALEFLEAYINNPSPTGYEAEGQKLWMDYLRPYVDTFITDIYGTAVGVINPEAEFKVVIEAHADEISWYVNHISDKGMIHVVTNGGSDYQIATSKKVIIHTKKGKVTGVFGWPAFQTRDKKDEKPPKKSNIFVDIGCKSRDEVLEKGVHVGCVITYPDEFFIMNGNRFVGRALDNRIGGFMIAQVARLLKEQQKELPFGLYITNSVQEEVGTRGAAMIVKKIQPQVAIITDVTHDTTTPMIKEEEKGHSEIGEGPVITYAPAVHNTLRELLIATAENHKIPFQRDASSTSTGTDTDAFAYQSGGVASALIALPIRYMHTTVEMVDRSDVENVIQLIYESLLAIDPESNQS